MSSWMCQLVFFFSFGQNVYFWRSINYCCTLVVMAKQQKIWSTKCVCWSRGTVRKAKTERIVAPGRTPRAWALPPVGTPAPICSPLRMSFFSICFCLFARLFVFLPRNVVVCQQTDRLYKSLIVTPAPSFLSSPLVNSRECLLQMRDKICIFSFQKKNKKTSVD